MTLVAMTVVVENDLPFIVAATDALLSGGTYSVHMPFGTKVIPLHNQGESGWLIGYAGNPSRFFELRDMISRIAKPAATAEEVISSARLCYEIYRGKLIEDEILSSYNIKMGTFRSSGLATFGPDKFNGLCARVDAFDVGVELVIGGFSHLKPASSGTRLARIFNPGIIFQDYVTGVSAVGEGASPALEFLYAVHNRFDSVYAALYRILEAKFIAEASARSVGPHTTLLVLAPDKSISVVGNDQCEKFRSHWKRRRKRLPGKMLKLLRPAGGNWL